jgi:LacI family transcriptional regulator
MSSLEAIAREVGVTPRTVSNVLNGKNKENWGSTAKRAAQIREVAERLGYQRNSAARAIRTGRFGSVALLLSTNHTYSNLYGELLAGVHDTLQTHNLHLVLSRLPDEELTSEDFIPKVLNEWLVDGLILNYNVQVPLGLSILLKRHRAPAIWTNIKREDDCVYPDDFEAGRLATEQLIQVGHRRIVYVAHDTTHYSREDRCNGYFAAMKAANLEPQTLCDKLPIAEWVALSQGWAKLPNRPTAAVTYNSLTAQALIFGAIMAGLKVPTEFSLITFEDKVLLHSGTGQPITTYLLPEYDMGAVAVEMLLERFTTDVPLQPRSLPFNGFEGETVAPPPRI